MEAHLAPKPSVQVNKITSLCEICSGPYDTNYCMEIPEQAFVDYASSRTNEVGDARLSQFEANFKQQQSEITNKIETFLKAINDRMTGAHLSDTVKNLKLNVNPTSSVLSARSYPIEDPQRRGFLATASAMIDYRKATIAVEEGITRSIFGVREINLGEEEVPAMMQVLTEGLNGGLEVTTQEALKLLIKWAHRRMLDGFGRSAFEIAESQSLEKETRHLAIDFLITLLEAASHWAENENDEAWESRNYSVVLEFLHRLAVKLYDNTVVWLVLEQYLAASEWQNRAAAIVTVSDKEKFRSIWNHGVGFISRSSPYVRLGAINETGRLFTNLDQDLQFQYHSRVLPALATTISDFQYPRVQARAVCAMVNISKNYAPDILTPYLHGTKMVWVDGVLCDYKFTLPKDQTGSLSNSWSVPEPSLFQIRGETYFEDHKKVTSESTLRCKLLLSLG
ncbi:MAK10-like protein [Tanacetum coccineum]